MPRSARFLALLFCTLALATLASAASCRCNPAGPNLGAVYSIQNAGPPGCACLKSTGNPHCYESYYGTGREFIGDKCGAAPADERHGQSVNAESTSVDCATCVQNLQSAGSSAQTAAFVCEQQVQCTHAAGYTSYAQLLRQQQARPQMMTGAAAAAGTCQCQCDGFDSGVFPTAQCGCDCRNRFAQCANAQNVNSNCNIN